jgi:hypothetical protein
MAPPPPYQAPTPLVNEEGKLLVQGAIKDANMARSNFAEMTQEDIIAGRNRARVQNMVDGGAPKSQYMARLAGGSKETLVNWGDGERILHEECAPYIDLIMSNETFGTTPIDRNFADDSTREDNEDIIAEELTSMLLEWGDFFSRKIASIMECKTHGISFDYHEDDINWQWRTAGLKDFKIHRNTLIGVRNIEECGVRVMLSPRTLYKKIKDPEIAKLAGWNVEAVREVIMRAAPMPTTYSSENFEEWEAYWKDNNYLMGGSKRVCPCIYFWHAELDGSVSQYLLPEDAGDEFLYQKSSRFSDISQFLHVYTDNVGTNTHYHSIRGLAHRLFSVVQTLNRKINRASDLSDFASSPILQPDSESEADAEATDQSGPFTILKPGWKIPDHKIPDYQQSVIPMMEFFRNRLSVMTSRVPTGQQQTGRPTKYGQQAEMEQSARLSDADMETYLIVWQGQWKEIVRRACRKNYLPVEPGGLEVAEFRRRCKQRGVPPEAIDNVDWKRARVSRGLGAGSAAARIVQLDRLQPWYSALDPVSQEKFKRMYFMAAGNVQLANELTPKTEDRILPVDASLADIQNNQIMQGMQIPVRDGQNHVVIAAIRLQKLTELNQAIVQGGGTSPHATG